MQKYQEQNSELTLQQGLDEFYSINPHFKKLSEPDGIKGLFFQHDITHVVFGLGSKLEEEHLLDSWALWGCKIKLKTMYEYMKHPAIKKITKEIYKDIGIWGIIKKIVLMLPLKLVIVYRALRMKKRWDYHNFRNEHLKNKLSDIRKEYNINIYIPK